MLLLAHSLEQDLYLLKLQLGRCDLLTDLLALRLLRLKAHQLRIVDVHTLCLRSYQVAQQVSRVALTGATVLYRRFIANALVLNGVLVLLERVDLVELVSVIDLL